MVGADTQHAGPAARALVFTDIVDSTRRSRELGDAVAASLWDRHDRAARELLARHGGHEIDRSDGFFLLFDSVDGAVGFALEYQAAQHSLGWSARVGLHFGAVAQRITPVAHVERGAKPLELDGLAKPFAARMMALARGGQVLLSEAVCARLGAAPDGLQIVSHGHYRFKGFEDPAAVFEIGPAGSSFLPPADGEKAYRVVSAGDGWRPAREIPHRLPAERDVFVGRADDLRGLALRFEGGARLVTLLGPAGTGKTRLAIRYGQAWLGEWPGGVWFCDLSDASTLDGIVFVVGTTLGADVGGADPVQVLGQAIAMRGRCLVVLDNFEQVATLAAQTVGRWLDAARDAAFLVTSRGRLRLAGEAVWPVGPLPVDTATDLFESRARAQSPAFVVDDWSRADVAQLVALLDGLPLAIELAAARINVMSPAQMRIRIGDRFALLAAGSRDASRHSTLRAAIDWSWDLLTPAEQSALAQCSVFEGGLTLNAAESVVDLAAWGRATTVVDALQSLVDQSLLRRQVPAGAEAISEPRFSMYLSVHDYAAEKLRSLGAGAVAAVERRHGQWFGGFGTDEAVAELVMRGGPQKLRALRGEIDNLVSACRRAVARRDGPVAVDCHQAACEVLFTQGPHGLAVALGEAVCAITGLAEPLRVRAWLWHAVARSLTGAEDGVEAVLLAFLENARATADRVLEARILARLGWLHMQIGSPLDKSRVLLEQAFVIAEEVGNPLLQSRVAINIGNIHRKHGNASQAAPWCDIAFEIQHRIGTIVDEVVTLGNRAELRSSMGDLVAARSDFDSALALIHVVGDRYSEVWVKVGLAELEASEERFAAAARLLAEASVLAHDLGFRDLEQLAVCALAAVLAESGRRDECRRVLAKARSQWGVLPDAQQEARLKVVSAELLCLESRFDEAQALLDAAELALAEFGDGLVFCIVHCARGALALTRGDEVQARLWLSRAEQQAATIAPPDLRRRIAVLRAAIGNAADGH